MTGIAEAASATFDETTDISVNNLTVFGDLSGTNINIKKIDFGDSNISTERPVGGLTSSLSIRGNNQSHLYVISEAENSHSSISLVVDEHNDNSPDWSFWNYEGKLSISRKVQTEWTRYLEFDPDIEENHPIKFSFGTEMTDISCSSLKLSGGINTDTINALSIEQTLNNGVVVDGVTLKDGDLTANNIVLNNKLEIKGDVTGNNASFNNIQFLGKILMADGTEFVGDSGGGSGGGGGSGAYFSNQKISLSDDNKYIWNDNQGDKLSNNNINKRIYILHRVR